MSTWAVAGTGRQVPINATSQMKLIAKAAAKVGTRRSHAAAGQARQAIDVRRWFTQIVRGRHRYSPLTGSTALAALTTQPSPSQRERNNGAGREVHGQSPRR